MWVLLQPPEAVKRNLAKVFGSCNIASADFPSKTPLFTHLLILLITEVGWRTFLIEVEKDLEKLV
jgi:hypothetical protein